MKAFANRRRIAIVKLLKKGRPIPVTSIASEIKLSVKATSKHLSVLSAAGVVDREQKSVQIFYFLASDMPALARKIIAEL
jgi:DNA-binding transcriptional ArsR family regulator